MEEVVWEGGEDSGFGETPLQCGSNLMERINVRLGRELYYIQPVVASFQFLAISFLPSLIFILNNFTKV